MERLPSGFFDDATADDNAILKEVIIDEVDEGWEEKKRKEEEGSGGDAGCV